MGFRDKLTEMFIMFFSRLKIEADLEGGRFSLQGFDPLPTRDLTPINNHFKGGARTEKRKIFGQNFPKSA